MRTAEARIRVELTSTESNTRSYAPFLSSHSLPFPSLRFFYPLFIPLFTPHRRSPLRLPESIHMMWGREGRPSRNEAYPHWPFQNNDQSVGNPQQGPLQRAACFSWGWRLWLFSASMDDDGLACLLRYSGCKYKDQDPTGWLAGWLAEY